MEFNRRRLMKGLSLGLFLPLTSKANSQELQALRDIQRKTLNLQQVPTRLNFGSCNLHQKDQGFWQTISEQSPDLFIAMGDNIYGDTYDMKTLDRKYRELKNNPIYRRFISDIPMLGTWDDHDFGWNNSGGDYGPKRQSQQLFCDFFNVPDTSPRRKRSGIYEAYDLGVGEKSVKIILLDTRFNRDQPRIFSEGEMGEQEKAQDTRDILGPEQWDWFEEELRTSTAAVNIIVSSIGVFSTSMLVTEDWDKFPYAHKKMVELIEKYRPSNLIILTGDKHFGGIFEREIGASKIKVLEIMSSGLTHAAPVVSRPFILTFFRSREIFLGRNFGELEFDWKSGLVNAKVKDIAGRIRMHKQLEIF